MDRNSNERNVREIPDDKLEKVSGGGALSGMGFDDTTNPDKINVGNNKGNYDPNGGSTSGGEDDNKVGRKPFAPFVKG